MALQGTLDDFGLVDVLGLIGSAGRDGRLRVTGPGAAGELGLAGGHVVSSDGGDGGSSGDHAGVLAELLGLAVGEFTFEAGPVDPGPGGPVPVGRVLAEARGLVEEWEAIVAVLGPLDARVGLAPRLPAGEGTLDADDWTVVAAVGAGTTVGDAVRALAVSRVPAGRRVATLVERGLLVVDRAEAPRPGPAPTAEAAPEPASEALAPPEPGLAPEPPESAAAGGPEPVDGLNRGAILKMLSSVRS